MLCLSSVRWRTQRATIDAPSLVVIGLHAGASAAGQRTAAATINQEYNDLSHAIDTARRGARFNVDADVDAFGRACGRICAGDSVSE